MSTNTLQMSSEMNNPALRSRNNIANVKAMTLSNTTNSGYLGGNSMMGGFAHGPSA